MLSRVIRAAGLVAMTVAAVVFLAGCNDGGGDDNGGSSNNTGGSVVGQWAMVNQEDGGQSWWQFNADGTFTMYNDAGFTSAHLGGTYTQNGNSVTGPFTNPGVGNGEIDCTLDGGTMQMDFIEYWHSPAKHVPLVGVKL